jgi:UDP-perosamine 4-acetyltransferase
MVKAVYLLGGGGHGRVVLDALLACGEMVTGVLDPNLSVGHQVFGVPVIGGDEFLNQVDPSEVVLVNGLGANPRTQDRRKLFETMKDRGFIFRAFQHPSAVIGRECQLAEGSQIMVGAVLQNRVQIGDNAVINTRTSIDHDCVIGPHAFISPGAVLCGDVSVETSAFVGAGAVVLPGVHIKENAIVGAGSVVTKTVPGSAIVAGNPAIKIGINA